MTPFSAAVCSDGKTHKIIQGIENNAFAQQKIDLPLNELRTERDTVRDLLKWSFK